MFVGSIAVCAALLMGAFALAQQPTLGVMVTLDPSQVASFDAVHNVTAVRLNPNRDMYLVTSNSGESDATLLSELETDSRAGNPTLNEIIHFNGQSTASVLNGQSTASVLNGQSTASVLNGQSTASVLNGQSTASVLNGQSTASVLNGQSTASVLNGQSTASVLNGQSTASVLNGQSTASVLNGQSTASVLNGQSTASVLNGQSTASVLNGQSTASVLNGQSTASVLNGQSTASVLNGQSTASVLNGQSTASVLNGQSTASVLNGQSTASVLNGQSTASVLNGQTTASVLNGQSTASVLNGKSTSSVLNSGETTTLMQSTASVLNSYENFYGTQAPQGYVNQPAVSQIAAGPDALALSTGNDTVVAEIDNGVAPFNPVLSNVLLYNEGWNFYDNSANWSAWADLAQSTASVLNGQSTASVLNLFRLLLSHSATTVLNGCAVPGNSAQTEGQSTASVLNGATVLDQSSAPVLNGSNQAVADMVTRLIEKILACDPDFGHGTAVAGLIHLIAPQAKILPIKAFGPGGVATSAAIYQSIAFAMDHHASVINMSFSASQLDPSWIPLVQEAERRGIVLIAAAGNGGASAPVYPASMDGVLGVGAVDGATAPNFARASFSNFDPSTGIVDDAVAAPGAGLITTFPGFGLVWATSSGTSFSAPLVSGEAALLAALGQGGQANSSVIESAADPAIEGDRVGGLGYGLVQVLGALKSAPRTSSTLSHGHPHGG